MKTEIIKNPEELQIISNPQTLKQTISKMAKQPKKAVMDLKDRMVTAGGILGGQAAGATLNAFVISRFLSGQSPFVQQASKVALPAISGLILASTKNEHLQNASLGLGVQGALEVIRLVVPGFSPSEGLRDASSFAYTSDGQQIPLIKRNDGRFFVPIPQKELIAGDGEGSENEDESQMVGEEVVLNDNGDWAWV